MALWAYAFSKGPIWAAFSSVGTFSLCIFTQNLTGLLYTKILNTHLLTQANVFHENKWGLVQDDDPKYTSKVVKNWMEVNMPKKLIECPSQSPDLKPIDNLFAWIKCQLNRLPYRRPKSIYDLKKKLNYIWDGINPDFLKPSWSSTLRCCKLATVHPR